MGVWVQRILAGPAPGAVLRGPAERGAEAVTLGLLAQGGGKGDVHLVEVFLDLKRRWERRRAHETKKKEGMPGKESDVGVRGEGEKRRRGKRSEEVILK